MPYKDYLNHPIAFDADGVLLNFLEGFGHAASLVTGRKCESQNPSYSLGVRFGITEDELARTWEKFNKGDYWSNLKPMAGAMEAVDALQTAGFTNLHIVTAIPEEFRTHRHDNFRKLGFSPEAIHCVEHTSQYAKVPPITMLKPFLFFDDRVEHLHFNPSVPLLIHIDHNDEQFPDPSGNGRIDASVKSVHEWVTAFLNDPQPWMQVAAKNSGNYLTQNSPQKKPRRSKP